MWLDSGLKHTREGIPGDNTDDTCLDLCIPLLPLHEGEVGWNFGQDCSSKTLAYAPYAEQTILPDVLCGSRWQE